MLNKIVLLLTVFLMLSSCNQGLKEDENKNTTEKNKPENRDTVTKNTEVKEVDSNELALQPENFKILFEIMNGKTMKIEVDSVITNEYILMKYGVYKVYHFNSDSSATAFYNELKTQELVLPMGINKRPKNIFLNGDIVIYMHMENSNGHNFKKYINQFNSVIKLNRSAINLDSIIGYRDCNCTDETADITKIRGKWNTKFITSISKEGDHFPYFNPNTFQSIKNLNSITISENKITMNNSEFETFGQTHSISLPDNYLFLKYRFLNNYWDEFQETDTIPIYISNSMKIFCESFHTKRQPIKRYLFTINDSGTQVLELFQFKDGSTFFVINNSIYKLYR